MRSSYQWQEPQAETRARDSESAPGGIWSGDSGEQPEPLAARNGSAERFHGCPYPTLLPVCFSTIHVRHCTMPVFGCFRSVSTMLRSLNSGKSNAGRAFELEETLDGGPTSLYDVADFLPQIATIFRRAAYLRFVRVGEAVRADGREGFIDRQRTRCSSGGLLRASHVVSIRFSSNTTGTTLWPP